jgi:uncharacterized membrane protein
VDLLLWAVRALHVFSVATWLGGFVFQYAIIQPIARSEGGEALHAAGMMSKRFLGFMWASLWTMAATGLLMMVLSPRFIWFRYIDTWSILLGLKQIVFLLMVLCSVGYGRMIRYLQSPASNGGFDERAELYRLRVIRYRKMSIALGVVGLLLAAGLRLAV